MPIKSNKLIPWIIGVCAVLIYTFPWIWNGESSYIRVHDSLDSLMIYYKIIGEQNFLFAKNSTLVGPIFLNGLPRISYPNELSTVTLLFSIFDPYWAYVLNQILIRLLAFFGMYILLDSILLNKYRLKQLIIIGVALCYCFLPFWAWTGSVACLPWVFYALYRIYDNKLQSPEIAIIVLYPLFSSIFLTGLYLILIFWVVTLLSIIQKRHFKKLLIGSILITISHITVDYRYVIYAIDPIFTSHRVDFAVAKESFQATLQSILVIFKNGEWAITLHNPIIYWSSLAVIFLSIGRILFLKFFKQNGFHTSYFTRELKILLILIFFVFGISVGTAIWNWEIFAIFKQKYPMINSINLTRISFFLPLIWGAIFAYTLAIIAKNKTFGIFFVIALIVSQLVIEIKSHEFLTAKNHYKITYKMFYSKNLFDNIAKHIPMNRSEYLTASIGLHPAVAQFNGFRTADAYMPNYPKDYKIQFRGAVFDEFSKKPEVLSYFDDWGNRIYFFSSIFGCPRNDSICTKDENYIIETPKFDINKMKNLGVKYIFSVPVLADAKDRGLEFLGTYSDPDSAWNISLYKLL